MVNLNIDLNKFIMLLFTEGADAPFFFYSYRSVQNPEEETAHANLLCDRCGDNAAKRGSMGRSTGKAVEL